MLIVADTLRANRLGCYGYSRPTSPSIDALAARGTLYEESYSQACWTIPSMISMMSGLYVTQDEVALPKTPTLAEVLQKNGIETVAFVANEALMKDAGFQRGLDRFETLGNQHASVVAAAFEKWHASREHPEKRFFAWVHFIDPHQPYEPEKEFDVFHGPRPNHDRLVPRWRELEPEVAKYSPNLKSLSFDEAVDAMEHDNDRYDGEVRQTDEGVKRVVAELARTGELENTLIVFAADHGEMLFEHPTSPLLIKDRVERAGGLPLGVKDLFGNGHRPWYFRDLWNTPLILAGPGIPKNARIRGLVQNLDIFPTVLESFDVANAPEIQGASLVGGVRPPLDRVFAHGHETSAVIDAKGRKLVVYPRKWFLLEGDGESPAVYYDASIDPEETRDLSAEHAEDVKALRGALVEWQAKCARDAKLDLTPEQTDVLRKLGYVDGK